MSADNITVGNKETFEFRNAHIDAKYTGGHSSKNHAYITAYYNLGIGNFGKSIAFDDSLKAGVVKRFDITGYTDEVSDYFNSSNKTSRTATAYLKASDFYLQSGYWSGGSYYDYFGSVDSPAERTCAITLTLDAPPTFDNTQPESSVGAYVVGEPISVLVFNTEAKYGGDISEVKFEIGGQSTTTVVDGKLTITPDTEGTFIPKVSVTDSRDQTTTKNLQQIIIYSEVPTWIEPYYGRTSPNDRCNDVDMTRIATNCAFLGCQIAKLAYTPNDITGDDWNTIVEFMQDYDDAITYSSDWQNLNKIEYALYENRPPDLSDTYWIMNDIIRNPYLGTKQVNMMIGGGFNIPSDSISFNYYCYYHYQGESLDAGYIPSDGWYGGGEYVHFIDGRDIADQVLIEWMNENATRIINPNDYIFNFWYFDYPTMPYDTLIEDVAKVKYVNAVIGGEYNIKYLVNNEDAVFASIDNTSSETYRELYTEETSAWVDNQFRFISFSDISEYSDDFVEWLNSNAQHISDENLVGTSWKFNDSIKPITMDYDIVADYDTSEFISHFDEMRIDDEKIEVFNWTSFSSRTLWQNGIWQNEDYKYIHITGGTDVTNSRFISWLKSNATQI